MKAVAKWFGLSFAALLAIASAFTQPPPPAPASPDSFLRGASVPPTILEKLQTSCRDCHSDSPRYPWYCYIAPVSWLIKRDVNQGREHLNFSRWTSYSLLQQERALSEIANQVQDREMPLPLYIRLHRDAQLSDADVAAIFEWTQMERRRLIVSHPTGVVPSAR